MGLGRYPEVNITAARKSAFEARAAISADYDPLELKQAEKEAARAEANTPMFEAAAHRVFEEIRPGFRNRKHADQWIGTLERYVFPVIGPRFVADLRASDFADVL